MMQARPRSRTTNLAHWGSNERCEPASDTLPRHRYRLSMGPPATRAWPWTMQSDTVYVSDNDDGEVTFFSDLNS